MCYKSYTGNHLTPMSLSAWLGDIELFYLLERHCSLKISENEIYHLLMYSAYQGNFLFFKEIYQKRNAHQIPLKILSTTLLFAASNGKVDCLKKIIDNFNLDPHVKDASGYHMGHYSLINGYIDESNTLSLEYDLSSTLFFKQGESLLHLSAQSGSFSMVQKQISHPNIQILDRDFSGNSVLHYAARRGQIDLIKTLISQYNLDPFKKNSLGRHVFQVLLYYGFVEEFNILSGSFSLDFSEKDNLGNNYAHLAARRSIDNPWLKHIFSNKTFLLEKNHLNENLMLIMSHQCQFKPLKKVFGQYNINPFVYNLKGEGLLHKLAILGDFRTLRLSQQYFKLNPFDKTKNGSNIALCAFKYGHKMCGIYLIEYFGIDPKETDQAGMGILQWSALKFDTATVSQLINKYTLNPKKKTTNGQTLLDFFIEGGHIEGIIDFSLKYSLNLKQISCYGDTLLHSCAKKGFSGLIRKLIVDHKLNPNAVNSQGYNFFHVALEYQHPEVVFECRDLLDPTIPTLYNMSLLHLVADYNDLTIFYKLIDEFNLDPMEKDFKDNTVLNYFLEYGNFNHFYEISKKYSISLNYTLDFSAILSKISCVSGKGHLIEFELSFNKFEISTGTIDFKQVLNEVLFAKKYWLLPYLQSKYKIYASRDTLEKKIFFLNSLVFHGAPFDVFNFFINTLDVDKQALTQYASKLIRSALEGKNFTLLISFREKMKISLDCLELSKVFKSNTCPLEKGVLLNCFPESVNCIQKIINLLGVFAIGGDIEFFFRLFDLYIIQVKQTLSARQMRSHIQTLLSKVSMSNVRYFFSRPTPKETNITKFYFLEMCLEQIKSFETKEVVFLKQIREFFCSVHKKDVPLNEFKQKICAMDKAQLGSVLQWPIFERGTQSALVFLCHQALLDKLTFLIRYSSPTSLNLCSQFICNDKAMRIFCFAMARLQNPQAMRFFFDDCVLIKQLQVKLKQSNYHYLKEDLQILIDGLMINKFQAIPGEDVSIENFEVYDQATTLTKKNSYLKLLCYFHLNDAKLFARQSEILLGKSGCEQRFNFPVERAGDHCQWIFYLLDEVDTLTEKLNSLALNSPKKLITPM